jgi:kynurenine--oxoglutarate transaminase/cysteine-S-conjugate beta-lyase/glutamine--phenylpyruvate transaminase
MCHYKLYIIICVLKSCLFHVCHQNCVYVCPTPIQEAVARAFELELSRLDSKDCYFNSISRDLELKRDFLAQVLTEVGMVPVIPEGGYFILADWSPLADKIDLSSETDSQADYRWGRPGHSGYTFVMYILFCPRFAKWLSKNRKLQGIPPSPFFSQANKSVCQNYIRFCFIKPDDKLRSAKQILSKWRQELDCTDGTDCTE